MSASLNSVFNNFCERIIVQDIQVQYDKSTKRICRSKGNVMDVTHSDNINKDSDIKFNPEKLSALMSCIDKGHCDLEKAKIIDLDGNETDLAGIQRQLSDVKRQISLIKNSNKFKALDDMKHYVANDMAETCGMNDKNFHNLTMCRDQDTGMSDIKTFYYEIIMKLLEN